MMLLSSSYSQAHVQAVESCKLTDVERHAPQDQMKHVLGLGVSLKVLHKRQQELAKPLNANLGAVDERREGALHDGG